MSKKSLQRRSISSLLGEPFWDHFGFILGFDFRSDSWHRVGTFFVGLLFPVGVQV